LKWEKVDRGEGLQNNVRNYKERELQGERTTRKEKCKERELQVERTGKTVFITWQLYLNGS
jgi:hypothetical protein